MFNILESSVYCDDFNFKSTALIKRTSNDAVLLLFNMRTMFYINDFLFQIRLNPRTARKEVCVTFAVSLH